MAGIRKLSSLAGCAGGSGVEEKEEAAASHPVGLKSSCEKSSSSSPQRWQNSSLPGAA